ncbi:MAG TPA: hypothetical protein VNV39_13895 [Stellaceae bacterium]|nr:hypothetical protein [Stellaceae bacterium]
MDRLLFEHVENQVRANGCSLLPVKTERNQAFLYHFDGVERQRNRELIGFGVAFPSHGAYNGITM